MHCWRKRNLELISKLRRQLGNRCLDKISAVVEKVLPVLSIVLSLGALGTLPTEVPICDRPLNYNPSAEALKVTHDSIEDVCTAGIRSARQDCGPVLLTIRSKMESDLFEAEVCIKGFRDILDQCITAGSTVTGALLTRDLRFNIAVAGVPAHEEGIRRRSALLEEEDFEVDDEGEDGKDDKEDDEDDNDNHKRLEARKQMGKPRKPKTGRKSAKVKSRKSNSNNKNHKNNTNRDKNKGPKKKGKGKKAKACTLKKTPIKGKGKRTTKIAVRDIISSLLNKR